MAVLVQVVFSDGTPFTVDQNVDGTYTLTIGAASIAVPEPIMKQIVQSINRAGQLKLWV